jgi:hypothetical protein
MWDCMPLKACKQLQAHSDCLALPQANFRVETLRRIGLLACLHKGLAFDYQAPLITHEGGNCVLFLF